jgi:hypothetical protein
MKVLVRVAFALLILLGLREHVVWSKLLHTGTDRMEELATDAAELGLRNAGPDESGLIRATASGCPLPVTLGLFALDGGEDASAAELHGPSMRPRYIYLGSVAEQVDRLHLWGLWLRANVKALLGLRQTRVPTKLVLAVLPEDCPHLAKLDWAKLSPRI